MHMTVYTWSIWYLNTRTTRNYPVLSNLCTILKEVNVKSCPYTVFINMEYRFTKAFTQNFKFTHTLLKGCVKYEFFNSNQQNLFSQYTSTLYLFLIFFGVKLKLSQI